MVDASPAYTTPPVHSDRGRSRTDPSPPKSVHRQGLSVEPDELLFPTASWSGRDECPANQSIGLTRAGAIRSSARERARVSPEKLIYQRIRLTPAIPQPAATSTWR